MKCLKCGTVNNKKNEKCKKCGENLHNEEIKVKPQLEKEEQQELKNSKEIESVANSKEKKKPNIFRKIWTIIKIIILLTVVALIGLVVYVYGFYDYKQYFDDNMNRYYKTESNKYLENIKLVFKIYGYNDEKIESVQDSSREIVEGWISEIKEKEYSSNEEYIDNLNYLQGIIESLYNDTEVDEHTAINKKTYISLSYQLKELINDAKLEEDVPNEENKLSEEKKYDVSMMNEVDLEGILELFESKENYVLYIGRENCSACITYLPTLRKAQEEYGYKTQYFDINKLNQDDSAYEEVVKKLSYEYEMFYDGNNRKETFGNWMGFTPMTIIIKDGKQVDGEIGSIDYATLTKMLDKNEIKKK